MKKTLLIAVAALSLASCSEYSRSDRALGGAAIGAGTGALIGGLATNSGGGAVVGGVLGAVDGVGDLARSSEIRRRRILKTHRVVEQQIACEREVGHVIARAGSQQQHRRCRCYTCHVSDRHSDGLRRARVAR